MLREFSCYSRGESGCGFHTILGPGHQGALGLIFEFSSRNPEHRFLSAQLLSGPLTFSFCVVRSSRTFFAHLSGVCVCLGSALPCEEGRLRAIGRDLSRRRLFRSPFLTRLQRLSFSFTDIMSKNNFNHCVASVAVHSHTWVVRKGWTFLTLTGHPSILLKKGISNQKPISV